MKINILEGYENGYSSENNSLTIRINTDLSIGKHIKEVIKNIDDIHKK